MVYKIGLIGAHGTGKTSLAALVEGELKRRHVETARLPEVPTLARQRGLKIDQETNLPTQLWILHRHLAHELEYTQERPNYPSFRVLITDRGPDNYCYLQHNCGHNPYALNMILGHLSMNPYQTLYLLPIVNDAIVDNGARDTDPTFQRQMDVEIRAFMEQHAIPHTVLPLPIDGDRYRHEWVKTIVNTTLRDLGSHDFMD